MLAEGDEVERYTVLRLLGAGGVANVYLVRHKLLGTLHALKLLRMWGDGVTDRLLEEGRVQARLQHPNLLRVHDAFMVQSSPALVMDYVDGPDLDRYVREQRPDLEAAEKLFRGIVRGVAAAHAAGVIHRDLKPANVLLSKSPRGGMTPQVGDFGIVRVMQRSGPGQTQPGRPMGTPHYMAPEQIRDPSTVDQRADIYALGCILYELVVHQRAFPGDEVIPLFLRIEAGDHQPIPSSLPSRLAETIERCLAVDPQDRPSSCSEILELLDRNSDIGGRPRPTAPPARPRAGGAVGWTAIAALAAIGVVLLALLSGAASLRFASYLQARWRPAPPEGPPALEPHPTPPDPLGPPPICTEGGGLLGHAPVPWVFEIPPGDTWHLTEATEVGPLPVEGSTDPDPVCTIPEGTAVEVMAPPLSHAGRRWLAIYADHLDRSSDGPPPPSFARAWVGDRCAGEPGTLLGWVWTRPRALGPRPRQGRNWRFSSARHVFPEPGGRSPDGSLPPPVCTLRSSATIDLLEAPVRGGGPREWWVPVSAGAIHESDPAP